MAPGVTSMNGPVVIAQATQLGKPGGPAGGAGRPLLPGQSAATAFDRIVGITKPEGDQAVTIYLGYEGKAKLDLTEIANENITLVHVGETLVILFDNRTTVTVIPFFD